ncbi:hypothetical protein PMAYCL1PPCAC_07319, partial [Pristionchus mayeri]
VSLLALSPLMCGGRKKKGDPDPFPSPTVVPSPNPSQPPTHLSQYELWTGDLADQASLNSSGGTEQLDNIDSPVLPKQKKDSSGRSVASQKGPRKIDEVDEDSEKNESEKTESEKTQSEKKQGQNWEEFKSANYTGGARYGSVSGGSHREYASMNEIKEMVEEKKVEGKNESAKEKEKMGSRTVDIRNQSGARYGSMGGGAHRECEEIGKVE